MPIEILEPRIAPAAGLTVTHLAAGGLKFTATDGADAIFVRSDEPGWLSFGTQNGDVIIDGVVADNPASIPMPKGAVTIDLLGGDDQLFLNPMVLPGSLTVNDPSGLSGIAITGLIVRGSLTLNGSSSDDRISIDGRLGVGKDFRVEFGGGTTDVLFNENRGLSITVGGGFRVHGTATTTIVALGLSLSGQLVGNIDTDPGIAEELDVPLALREFRVGRDVSFEAAGAYGGLLLSAAEGRVGGSLVARATGVGGVLDYFHVNEGPLRITSGVQLEAGGGTSVLMEGLNIKVGGSIDLHGGSGDDTFTIFGNNSMRLPKTTLAFGDGATNTRISAREPWTLAGALAITAGSGDDTLQLRGPGKVTGSVTGDFGNGMAAVTVNGDGAGRMSVGSLLKMNALTQLSVGVYNATVNGRIEVIGHGGDDLLAFDSVRVTGPVVFTGSAGADGFAVDDTVPGYLTPSVFRGPVTVDLGDHTDTVIIGREVASGRATFFGPFSVKGILGENYTVANAPTVIFKKTPSIS